MINFYVFLSFWENTDEIVEKAVWLTLQGNINIPHKQKPRRAIDFCGTVGAVLPIAYYTHNSLLNPKDNLHPVYHLSL